MAGQGSRVEQARAVEAHLRSCAEFRRVTEGFRDTGALIRRASISAPAVTGRGAPRDTRAPGGSFARRLAVAGSSALALLLLVLAVSLVADWAATLRAPADSRG